MLGSYPLLEEGYETELVVSPSGVSQKDSASPAWRLRSLDHSWTVTVASGSVAIETNEYKSRTDFIEGFKSVIAAFVETIGASTCVRLGVRYTNQVSENDIDAEKLGTFFRPEVRGGLSIPIGNAVLHHGLNDTLFSMGERSVQGRWGIIPPHALFDPTLGPTAYQSWFLDVDSFSVAQLHMSAETIGAELSTLADQAYRLFRWLVTDEFIAEFRDER